MDVFEAVRTVLAVRNYKKRLCRRTWFGASLKQAGCSAAG